MAIDVAIDSTIERTPDDVFATVADLDAWPTWLIASGIRSVQRERAGEPSVGERLVVQQDAAGRASTFDAQVTGFEPGRHIALRGRDRDGVTIDMDAAVAPTPGSDGRSTELQWSIRIGLPLKYRFFESMARPQVERAALLDVESLRLRLETPAED
jgi:uncharacterized protein YndB with AHSA1/START domain